MESNNQAGSTQECLMDFSHRYTAPSYRAFMAEFTGVVPDTVDAWIRSERMPKGMALLGLRCFLTGFGYRVTEFESLPDNNKKLAKIIGFKVVPPHEATAFLGYSDDHAVYRQTLQGRLAVPGVEMALERLCKQNQAGVEEAERHFAARRATLATTANGGSGTTQSGVADPPIQALFHALLSAESLAKAVFGGGLGDLDTAIQQFHGLMPPEKVVLVLESLDRLKVARD